MKFNLVIVRKNMLAENYGAHLWNQYTGSEVVETDAITSMDSNLVDKIRGKNILIVGGYYRDYMESVLSADCQVSVFYNSSDDVQDSDKYIGYHSDGDYGFLIWTVDQLNITDSYILTMSKYLDEYFYGYPSEKALCFRDGFCVIPKNTDLEKILTIQSVEDVDKAIVRGRENRISTLLVAQERLSKSEEFNIQGHTALVCIGDSPIVDTCLLLAEKSKSGLGIVFRYDLKKRKTFISVRSTKESGIDDGKIAKQIINGGGSKPMGGGSISGLFFHHQYFY